MTDREEIKAKLRSNFDGKIVRKDLTKKIKEGANVPVYVLEFLLGQYCGSDDEQIISQGIEKVKKILADNFVRPDEAQKTLSVLRSKGMYTVIDKITINLNIRTDQYVADFSNLGITGIPISSEYPEKYDRLLCGGIWCIVQLEYVFNEQDKHSNPIKITKLTPIQMPHVDINDLKEGRKSFSKEEWIDVLLRSIGMEPDQLNEREKWLLLLRLVPLVENNYNLCELGPRSTGKSHIYKEISPNSILVSGGQTTVANLFYNMNKRTVGLVGLWDCVAFDEVAGIKFKDKDGIQIMKDYMASGSFARGKEEKAASASMVFVGNINQSVDVLLKTSSLFDPFPPEMATDTAFLDRIHCYLPGWEVPKFRPEHFTDDHGFITDYFAEFIRELGILEKGQLVEVDRSEIVAGYVGQTALKTKEKIDEAMGGILFIDEAYTLAKGENDFGQEAIDTLLKAMEDHRDEFIVIVAGYDEPMESFLQSNPGLKSRFNEYIHFDDYSEEELFMIFGLLCEQNDFRMDLETQDTLKSYLNELCKHKPDNFANGREMRNLFDKSKKAHSNRLASLNEISDKDLIAFKKDDVLNAIEEMKLV